MPSIFVPPRSTPMRISVGSRSSPTRCPALCQVTERVARLFEDGERLRAQILDRAQRVLSGSHEMLDNLIDDEKVVRIHRPGMTGSGLHGFRVHGEKSCSLLVTQRVLPVG